MNNKYSLTIRLEDVHKSYAVHGQSVNAVRGVSIQVNQDSRLGIVGKSGSGKSTLLHILSSLEKPSSGSVFFNDKDIGTLADGALSLLRGVSVGMVFQMNNLLPEFNAVENVMMPALIAGVARKDALDRAVHLLSSVDLDKRMNHRPSELSGGEQQRVAVARALVMEPKILFADEPTGNLDEKTSVMVQNLFFEMADKHKTGLVIVTHDMDFAQNIPEKVYMEDGKILKKESR